MNATVETQLPNKNKSSLSIVIPCYNEEEVINNTISRIIHLSNQLSQLLVEIIFVDDGSTDNTFHILANAANLDGRIKVIRLSRNFGHQLAVTAGIDYCAGQAVVLMDADLQDPPEVVHEMVDKWLDGYDVVYGVRTERSGESNFKLTTAKIFYRLLNKLASVSIPLDTGDFRLMDRSVVDALKSMPEQDRFIRGMVAWIGFRQYALPYKRSQRVAGATKYPVSKMLKFALDGIFSFSSKPLQMSIGLGFMCAILALFGIFYALILRLFTSIWVEGWTALMIAILFIGGVQLICLGILGEYVGRIYNAAKNRPLYFINQSIGFSGKGLMGTNDLSRKFDRS